MTQLLAVALATAVLGTGGCMAGELLDGSDVAVVDDVGPGAPDASGEADAVFDVSPGEDDISSGEDTGLGADEDAADVSDEDVDRECPTTACLAGSAQCTGPGEVRRCVPDADGCGVWQAPEACEGGGACESNACVTCIDNDRDGYGQGCVLGPDCNDADPTTYPGAPEVCDGRDNNCNGVADEGYDVGQSCSVGMGECTRTGRMVCASDRQSTRCNATPGTPTPEICDGIDNNCDGRIDEGGVCEVCREDAHEPNNSSSTGTQLAVGQSRQMALCPGDNAANAPVDWFRLGTYNAGQRVTVEIDFLNIDGNLDLEMYVNYAYEVTSNGSSDGERIDRVLTKSGPVDVRVYFKPGTTIPPECVCYTIRR